MSDTKACTGCSTVKPPADFPMTGSECKACSARGYRRKYREANREKIKASNRAYNETRARPEHVRERDRAAARSRYSANLPASQDKWRTWEAENPEANRARGARYKEGHRSEMAAMEKARYAASQLESHQVATRNGFEWSGWEMELVSDYKYTTRQLAEHLGRTFAAVTNMRKKIKHDPQTIQRAGLSESGIL